MLLYHCNFGYPIVSADSRIYTSGGGVEPRDPTPAQAVADHDRLGEPQAGYVEQCFYHDLKAKDGRAFAAIFNERLGVGGYVRYRVENLPQFVQWKMLGEQEYVVGLEPATHRLDRRAELIRQGRIVRLPSANAGRSKSRSASWTAGLRSTSSHQRRERRSRQNLKAPEAPLPGLSRAPP